MFKLEHTFTCTVPNETRATYPPVIEPPCAASVTLSDPRSSNTVGEIIFTAKTVVSRVVTTLAVVDEIGGCYCSCGCRVHPGSCCYELTLWLLWAHLLLLGLQ